jgi:hypothetical protein
LNGDYGSIKGFAPMQSVGEAFLIRDPVEQKKNLI